MRNGSSYEHPQSDLSQPLASASASASASTSALTPPSAGENPWQAPSTTAERPQLWRDLPQARWDDWRWQQGHRIRDLKTLEDVIPLTPAERSAFAPAAERFRMAITPYYASLIRSDDPNCPIRKQAIPDPKELKLAPGDLEDPLAEEAYMPVPGLTHRYPDRALLYATHNCPVYCRHCLRKRKVGDPGSAASKDQLKNAIAHIEKTPQIRDVLLSGGDPLSLSDARLDDLLGRLLAIEHLEMVRLATRNPVTLPQRITQDLATMLAGHRPVYVNTHFNHIHECTPEAAQSLEMLADAGCVLGNQMVLLRGINDDGAMVQAMNRWLLRHRCKPYYMFHCDAAEGISHFRTPIRTGLKILNQLRGWTTGMAVPHYVVDLPGGGGKVALTPENATQTGNDTWQFQNYAGESQTYTEMYSDPSQEAEAGCQIQSGTPAA